MSEYTDEILKRAGLKPGSKSIIIDSKKSEYSDEYVPTIKGQHQIMDLKDYKVITTPNGVYAVAGTTKKDKDAKEEVLARLAADPEKVADLTSEERRFLESRGYVRGEDKRKKGVIGTIISNYDSLASEFMDGKEPSAFWTGKKPTYKKTR
jgi:hypothetical protein